MRLEHQSPNGFDPIYIVIESMQELEELYGVLCYTPITHLNSTTLKLFDLLFEWSENLNYGINYHEHFDHVQRTLKRAKDAVQD